jgi:stage II sporulation protein R
MAGLLLLLLFIPSAFGGMREEVVAGYIRLHVKANSDLPADQELKNVVRDTVLYALAPELEQAASATDAAMIVDRSLEDVVRRAETAVRDAGFDYPVRAWLGVADFPTCIYGNTVFHAGRYRALTVELGAGRGQNWWCVLFPPLCFVELPSDKELPAMSGASPALQPRSRLLEWWSRRKGGRDGREVGVAKRTGFLYNELGGRQE